MFVPKGCLNIMEKQLVFVFVFKSLFFDGTLLKSVIRTFYFCYVILLFPNFSNSDIYYNITIMNIVIYVCELSAYVTMSVFRVSVRPCKVKVIITASDPIHRPGPDPEDASPPIMLTKSSTRSFCSTEFAHCCSPAPRLGFFTHQVAAMMIGSTRSCVPAVFSSPLRPILALMMFSKLKWLN